MIAQKTDLQTKSEVRVSLALKVLGDDRVRTLLRVAAYFRSPAIAVPPLGLKSFRFDEKYFGIEEL